MIIVRPACPSDVELIHGLIVELATYERAPEQVVGTPEMLARALFGQDRAEGAGNGAGENEAPARGVPVAEALIAELDGEPAGFALFHSTFSTWECRAGIWLEDLYVPPRHRRHGVGRTLLAELARITVTRDCARLEWTALNWNAPALDFYAQVGAMPMPDWIQHRLDGQALARVAGEAPPPR